MTRKKSRFSGSGPTAELTDGAPLRRRACSGRPGSWTPRECASLHAGCASRSARQSHPHRDGIRIPGLGWSAVQAISQQDLPIIVGIVVLAAAFVVLANVLVDIVYAVLDPRARLH
ncbi:MAG TPA: ABC transporter permease subunit [Trebonia sp.]|nr:ABC transporter permease subunit [Trebonia sp.]